MKRYQWNVLPQKMASSPTLCQTFVAQAIQVVSDKYPEAYIIHYMDDILCSYADPEVLSQLYELLKIQLDTNGLRIAPEKVQRQTPFFYLGTCVLQRIVQPQKVEIKARHLHTLKNFQKLLGDINWL